MIVLDNSVLSAFTRLDNLDLIRELFNEAIIPEGVHEEYAKGWGRKALPNWVSVEKLGEGEIIDAESLSLGVGESQAIILALRQGCPLGLDDENARGTAKNKGATIIGSIGILRLAYELCPIETKDQLKALLEKLTEDLYIENWLLRWAMESHKKQRQVPGHAYPPP